MSENLMFMQMLKSYRATAPMIPEIIRPNDDLEKYYFDFVEKENQVDEFIKDLATARTQQMRQQKLLELMQTVY